MVKELVSNVLLSNLQLSNCSGYNMENPSTNDIRGIVVGPTEVKEEFFERKIGLISVVIISLSAMLGSGLFVLPALAMLEMGGGTIPVGGVWLAYFLAAIVVLPAAISKSELASAMPFTGGTYVYVQKTFGALFGTISGLGLWANFMLKSAFALIGFKAYLWVIEAAIGDLTGLEMEIDIQVAALLLLIIIIIINIRGLKSIKKVQTPIILSATTFLLGLSMWSLITMPINWDSVVSKEAFGGGISSVATTAAFVFVSYAGVTKIAAVGGEIKNPNKNIPNGILLSLLISCFLYVFITFSMAAVMNPSDYLEEDDSHHARHDPVYIFAEGVGGELIGTIAALFSVVVMTSMAVAGMMAASRFPFAMAKDKLIPDAFGKVHPKFQTPQLSIIFTGLSMGLAITFLPVHDVAELASGFKIMIFIVINFSVIILRTSSSSHNWYMPEWKSPMYPFTQFFGVLAGFWLLILMGTEALIGASTAIILGLLIFKSYGEKYNESIISPWNTFTLTLKNSDEVEIRRKKAAFFSVKTRNDNDLDFDEFTTAMNFLKPDTYEKQYLSRLFSQLDNNKNGKISLENFMQLDEDALNQHSIEAE